MTVRINLGRKDEKGNRLVALLNEEDKDLASYSWYAHGSASGWYAAFRQSTPPRTRLWLHKMVGERMFGRELNKGEIIDHINRNKLDNRRTNLRLATKTQNEANKRLTRGRSKYRGVSFDKSKKRWRAIITKDKKQTFLGYFDKEIDAAIAYNEAASEMFGEFAVMNEVV